VSVAGVPAWLGRIVSGGQTGVDRAGLSLAISLGIPHGGWVPAGRRAEDGSIPARFDGLRETDSAEYAVRTRWNVRDSDATLIVTWGTPTGGTRLTVDAAKRMGRPVFVADLERPGVLAAASGWLAEIRPATLNIAGPRESGRHLDVQATARAFLRDVMTHAP
jgi:hypothetical protein